MKYRDRAIANSVLGGLDLYATVVWLGKHVFQAVGLAEWAQGLNALMPVAEHTSINWPSIYAMSVCLTSVALCIVNFQMAFDWINGLRLKRLPSYDATAEEVTLYIATKSVFGATFSEDIFFQSAFSLWTKLELRKIRAVGRRPLAGELSQIMPKDIEGATAHVTLQPNYYGHNEVGKFQIIENTKTKSRKVLFDGVYLDWRDVRKIWPRKP